MPFTISHIAAIYPLSKTKQFKNHFDALVVGTVLPDLLYFLPFELNRSFSHSLKGSIIFSIPLGLILVFFFRRVLIEPLFYILPDFMKVRLTPKNKQDMSFSSFCLLLISLSVGVGSHLFWDAFTHGDSIFKYMFPADYNFYFQFYSSVLGLLLLVLWIGHWIQKTPARFDRQGDSYPNAVVLRFIIFFLPLCLSFALSLFSLDNSAKRHMAYHISSWVMFGGGQLLTIFVLVYAVLFKLLRKYSSPVKHIKK